MKEFDLLRKKINKIADNILAIDGVYPVWSYGDLMQLIDSVESECYPQPDCTDCIKNGGDYECDHVHCRKEVPSVQPELRTAYWTKDIVGSVICSKCGGIRKDNRISHMNFCNCCGADMRGTKR